MVCEKCEAKLTKLAAPDTWQDRGSKVSQETGVAAKVSSFAPMKAASAGPQNMLLKNKKLQDPKRVSSRFDPIARRRTCRICKSKVSEEKNYCQQCAYQKGICAMCGRKVLDTAEYKMSAK